MALEKPLEVAFGMAMKRLLGYLRGEMNEEPMEDPWRNISREENPWTEEFKEKLVLKNLRINPGGKVKFLNVLLLGQVASGKSSFINTCDTAISNEERVKSSLPVLQSSSSSVTKKLETIPFKTEQGKEIPVRIFDCRGLHMEHGVPTEDIRLIVDGHVKDGYTINPEAPISEGDKCYRAYPKLEDRMHCIVYVINADNPTGHLMDTETREQLKGIRDNLQQRNVPVPQVLLLTKVDRLEICNTKDLKLMFRSHVVQRKCNDAAQYIGLHPQNVFPMSNYFNHQVQCLERDILALFNLYNIMAKANDFVKRVAGDDLPPGFKKDKSDDSPSNLKDNKSHDLFPGFSDDRSNLSHDFKDDKSNDLPAGVKGVKSKEETSDHLPDFVDEESNDLPPSFNDEESKIKED